MITSVHFWVRTVGLYSVILCKPLQFAAYNHFTGRGVRVVLGLRAACHTDQAEMNSLPNFTCQKGRKESWSCVQLSPSLGPPGALAEGLHTTCTYLYGITLSRSYLSQAAEESQPCTVSTWLCNSHHFSQLLFCCQPASVDLEAFFPLSSPPFLQLSRFEERA